MGRFSSTRRQGINSCWSKNEETYCLLFLWQLGIQRHCLERIHIPLVLSHLKLLSTLSYLAIIEWGWVWFEEFSRSPSASVDNTLWDLQNSSYLTKAEFNNCLIIHSKYMYFPVLKGVLPFRFLFFCSPKEHIIVPRFFLYQQFNNLTGAYTFDPILMSLAHYDKVLSKFGQKQLVMVNYVWACGFNQSETEKYFEWLIIIFSHFYIILSVETSIIPQLLTCVTHPFLQYNPLFSTELSYV